MTQFFSTLTLGIIATFVGTFLQHAYWKRRTFEEIKTKEREDASKIIEQLGRAVDRRLVAQRDFMNAINNDANDNDSFLAYKTALFKWMEEFSSFKSKIYLYFGRDEMYEFENSVHMNLYNTASIITRTHKYGLGKLSRRDQREHAEVGQRMSIAHHEIVRFLNRLNEKVENFEIGRSRLVDNVKIGHLESISYSFLLLRLFGVKP